MRILLLSFSIFIAVLFLSGSARAQSQSVDYQIYDQLLQKYVSDEGLVDYNGFSHDPIFKRYVSVFTKVSPQSNWTKEEAMAYWINCYNIFTIQLMLDNMPVKSIMDIENAWDRKFINVGGTIYSLNQIEHEILRKDYFDPRIHFAVNCASFSCPKLHNRAFTAQNLKSLLDQLAIGFINDPKRNVLSSSSVQLSQLFDWYKEDFTKNGSLIDFINKYSKTQVAANAKLSFLEYNWSINSK